MVAKQLIINITDYESRVALIEGGQVSEYYIERNQDKGIVGSVYKGKVVRVLPGIQSCFVDIGLDRSAFLYSRDIQTEDEKSLPKGLEDEDNNTDKNQDDDFTENQSFNDAKSKYKNISDLVKEGQEIVVQVIKDAISTKGPRVTTYLSFPGRFVVLMPNIDHIGVSRRISNEEERARLKEVIQKAKPAGVGIIARTAVENVSEDKIAADIEFLKKIWETIKSKSQKQPCPSLIYEDLNLVFRTTRDLIFLDLDRVVIDNKRYYEDLVRFLNRFSVKLGAQVQLYSGDSQIFDAFGIEHEISHALGPKVWLKSGGYLIIEQTEALAAIDVNTGRFVGGRNLGDTILRTNLEAVKEIVHQLRLRNIGGIIILDFIDMDKQEDRDKVFQFLFEELKKDKAKTTVLRISEMGLVQMTRKRTEESLLQKISMTCPYCDGSGYVRSLETTVYEILRELVREQKRSQNKMYILKAHPQVIDRLYEEDKIFLEALKNQLNIKVLLKAFNDFHVDHFEISSVQNY